MTIPTTPGAERVVPYVDDPHLDKGTKAFLKVLNSGGHRTEKVPEVSSLPDQINHSFFNLQNKRNERSTD
jgi:hypothetical protein